MNDNNTYTVNFKGEGLESGCATAKIETLASFDCSKERYMYVIDRAIKNGLAFAADDGIFKNENGGRHYYVNVYIY